MVATPPARLARAAVTAPWPAGARFLLLLLTMEPQIPNGRTPWWARCTMWLVDQRGGVLLLICAVLMAVAQGWVPSPALTAIEQNHQILVRHAENDWQILALLRLICEHTAADQQDRDRCIGASGEPQEK